MLPSHPTNIFLPSFQTGMLTRKLLMRLEISGGDSGYFLDILTLRIYTYT